MTKERVSSFCVHQGLIREAEPLCAIANKGFSTGIRLGPGENGYSSDRGH